MVKQLFPSLWITDFNSSFCISKSYFYRILIKFSNTCTLKKQLYPQSFCPMSISSTVKETTFFRECCKCWFGHFHYTTQSNSRCLSFMQNHELAHLQLYMLFCSISKNVVTYPYGISLLIIIFSTITLSIFTMQNYLFFVFIQYFTYTLKKLIKALISK